MANLLLQQQAKLQRQARPEIRPGFTVRVHERIREGDKERIQIFEGLVIAVHAGHTAADSTFTVRRIVSGVGVEKVFSLHSKKIEKIEVKKIAKVRRAKLFFLRGRHGKSARLSERFTTADEYGAVVPEHLEGAAIPEETSEGQQSAEGDASSQEQATAEAKPEAKTEDKAQPDETPQEEAASAEKKPADQEEKKEV